jgi:hypothetical protein
MRIIWRLMLAFTLVIAVVTLVPAARAEAVPGDYLQIKGRIIVWPPGKPAEGVAVVRGADGKQYFVRFTPETAVSPDLGDGASVTIVGREGLHADVIHAATVEHP